MVVTCIDGGIMSIKMDNCFISISEVMEVVVCLTFLDYPSSEFLPNSSHSRERVRVLYMTAI